jgi:hypothetical protein
VTIEWPANRARRALGAVIAPFGDREVTDAVERVLDVEIRVRERTVLEPNVLVSSSSTSPFAATVASIVTSGKW